MAILLCKVVKKANMAKNDPFLDIRPWIWRLNNFFWVGSYQILTSYTFLANFMRNLKIQVPGAKSSATGNYPPPGKKRSLLQGVFDTVFDHPQKCKMAIQLRPGGRWWHTPGPIFKEYQTRIKMDQVPGYNSTLVRRYGPNKVPEFCRVRE